MPLSTELVAKIAATLTSVGDLATASDPLSHEQRFVWTSGVGANQADKIFHDQRTLAASATEDLDLAGVLTDRFGATITLARIKAIIVKAASGNTNNVNVTRPAANGVPLFLAASDGIPVLPGGTFMWIAPNAAGIAVTAGTGDLLTFTNSGAGSSVTYDVIIVGASS